MKIENTPVTATDICRLLNVSQQKSKSALARCQPVQVKGRARYYRLADALAAVRESSETSRERKERIEADILQARLERIKGESLNRDDCFFVYKEIIIGLRRVIEASDKLTRTDQSRFATYLKHEYSALWDKLRDCRFPEAKAQPEGSNEDDDDDE